MKKTIALCAILAVTTALPAFAHDHDKKGVMVDKHFEMMDTNKDGKISQDESEDFAERKFKDADANSDGFVTKAEAKTYHEEKWSKWKDKKMSKDADAKRAANANPTEHSENPTNPAQNAR